MYFEEEQDEGEAEAKEENTFNNAEDGMNPVESDEEVFEYIESEGE